MLLNNGGGHEALFKPQRDYRKVPAIFEALYNRCRGGIVVQSLLFKFCTIINGSGFQPYAVSLQSVQHYFLPVQSKRCAIIVAAEVSSPNAVAFQGRSV